MDPHPSQISEACAARDRLNYPGSTIGSIGPMDVNKFYCRGIVCVTVDGDVTPCSVIRKGFGNIHSRSLGEILRDHCDPLLFLGLSTGDPDCRGCPDERLCWGCRAAAYYATGDLLGKDPVAGGRMGGVKFENNVPERKTPGYHRRGCQCRVFRSRRNTVGAPHGRADPRGRGGRDFSFLRK